jgi:hypothetical protein
MPTFNFTNVGFLIEELNPFVFQRIKKEAQIHKKDFEESGGLETSKDLLRAYGKRKLGYTKEYTISPETTELLMREVFKFIEKFENQFDYFNRLFNYTVNIEQLETRLELERVWVNFQRPAEFLPMHCHSGLYSFVLWVSVPFDIADEKDKEANPDLVKNATGNFEFMYTDALGKMNSHFLAVDRQWEGRIAIFPAELHHQVYPFYTSNDVRISLAGNVRLGMKK